MVAKAWRVRLGRLVLWLDVGSVGSWDLLEVLVGWCVGNGPLDFQG